LSDLFTTLFRYSLVIFALIVLGACASDEDEDTAPCPAAKVMAQPSELTRYRDGPGRDPTDVRFEARMMRVHGECGYHADGGEIEVELDVTMDILRGPALEDGKVSYRYFVAVGEWVSAEATEPVVHSRESFAVETVIPAGRRGLSYNDVLEISIPRPDDRDVRNYVIYLGFELTRDELKHNRDRFGY
jgi:hypothetical protein